MKNHIESVHQNDIYSCDHCDVKTKWKGHIKNHIKSLHQNVIYNCDKCEYKSKWKEDLKSHTDSEHGNVNNVIIRQLKSIA